MAERVLQGPPGGRGVRTLVKQPATLSRVVATIRLGLPLSIPSFLDRQNHLPPLVRNSMERLTDTPYGCSLQHSLKSALIIEFRTQFRNRA
ncbi:hypothetical protein CDAR_20581 [Caerostris darwini]|uniref:Uncharacterized protein n=1 Tax=Caerostris darwini TaxID=1538125 RepID=A0AAV4QIS8_9ARAC|nr:hypothetical protein CDAR_20581 [Caerostris darwini]